MRAVAKYPGAKYGSADWIISKFTQHRTYLEPFFGSGGVFFNKPRSDIETINDLDGDVVNLFKWIKEDPEKLATFRRFGKTTAEALRELLNTSAPPIDYTAPPRNPREKFHRQTVIEIKEKLERNGIETRKILRSRKEKDAWLKEAREKHADGFWASVFIHDETIKKGVKLWL